MKWLTHLIEEKDCIWNTFPKYVFGLTGGVKFMLTCDYKIDRLPVKLSNFHKQALLAWKLIYKHNCTPTNYYIWNNKDIQYKKKSLYYGNWVANGIVLVKQLLNADGQLLKYNEFLSKFQFAVTPREYAIVVDAVPRSVLQLLRGSVLSVINPLNSGIFLGGIDITKNKCSNKHIRNCIQEVTLPSGRFFWASIFGEKSG